MRKRIRKLVFLLVMACIISMGVLAVGSAAEQVLMPALNEDSRGELSAELALTNETGTRQVFEGIVLNVYQVADLTVTDGVPAYTLKTPFAESNINVENLSASESAQAAAALAEIAAVQDPDLSAATDQNGCVVFSELKHGMYLVVMQENENSKVQRLAMSPYLVSLPMADKTEQGYFWNYIVKSYPKTEIVKEENKGQILITKKTSMYSGENTETMTVLDEVFYFGLFLDAEGTKPYSDNFMKSVHLGNTSSGTAVFENLPAGTYYVFETDANGMPVKDGDKVSGSVFAYTCNVESDTQQIVFTPEWEVTEGQVAFNNIYDELPEGYYFEPKIRITKQVLDGEKEIESDETFYAGIFSEQNGSYVLEQVVELVQNGTVETGLSIQLTEGAALQKFLIFETDKEGNRVNKDTFGYTIEGEGIIEVSMQHPDAEITIINRRKSESETETTTTGGTSSTGGGRVRTGDDTPIVLYIAVMAAALIVILLLIILRKSRKTK